MNIFITQVTNELPSIGVAILIFIAFWFIARFAVNVIRRFAIKNTPQRQPVFLVMETFTKVTILIIGAITALGSAGMNVSALVASLGLSGLALTVATKDAFANLLAGILVIIYQPFEIGDVIEVSSFSGEVTKMSLRYTHLINADKEILIPNGSLLTNNIVITKAPRT